jgi:hypothetical protein
MQSPWRRIVEDRTTSPIAVEQIVDEMKSVPAHVNWEEFLYLVAGPESEESTGAFDTNTTKLRKAFFGVSAIVKAMMTEPVEDHQEIRKGNPHTEITQYGNSFSPTGLATAFFGQPRSKAEARQPK